MSEFPQTASSSDGPATVGIASLSDGLMQILAAQPGDQPGYELCKSIYTEHPLGAKIAEAPIRLAQSQEREIKIPGAPEEDLKKAFLDEWKKLGNNRIEAGGADRIIRQICVTSRIYGIASGGMVCKGYEDMSEPIPKDEWYRLPLQFSVWDPLNTAGSLVLNQDPTSVDFMKPKEIQAGGKTVHPSRTIVKMQEMPVWIKWSDSAFGFVGRSVYQRPLYPLKTYLLAMIADGMVAEKVGLLVYKAKPPGSIIDKITLAFNALKRQILKGSKTGQVVQIGINEELQSINLQMLSEPLKISKQHIKEDIAAATPMPSALLAEETLTAGFGEGTNDYKLIVSFIAAYRAEITPVYDYFDEICQRKAWKPEFYETMQRKHADYKKIPYETAFQQWRNAFSAQWPNLMQEPDSELVKIDESRINNVTAISEMWLPNLEKQGKQKVYNWISDELANNKIVLTTPLPFLEEDDFKEEAQGQEPETSAAYDITRAA